MLNPVNYQIQQPSQLDQMLSGLKIGASIASIDAQREAEAAAQERQNMLNQQFRSLVGNPSPTARDFVNVAMLLPEKDAASLRANWDALSKAQQENDLRFGGQVMSAFSSNAPDVGIRLLMQRAEAERNYGREDKAGAYETYAKIAEQNPRMAEASIGTMLGSIPGGDKVLDSSVKARKASPEQRILEYTAAEKEVSAINAPAKAALENANTKAQIRNIESQIYDRSGRMALDRDKLQSDIEMRLYELGQKSTTLDDSARKIVNDSSVAAVSSEQSAAKMLDLAGKIEAEGGGFGAATKFNEWIARQTGNENALSLLRQEYARVRNSAAMKSLPPGAASDKDVAFALKGMPEESANAQAIGSFLRGMAKMQQIEASTESAKAEWVNSTGSLGRAKRDIDVGGVQVPAGTTFVDFMRDYGDKRAQSVAAQQSNAALNQRSYMRWAK